VYDGIPYQVKQRAGDWGIVAENMENSWEAVSRAPSVERASVERR